MLVSLSSWLGGWATDGANRRIWVGAKAGPGIYKQLSRGSNGG